MKRLLMLVVASMMAMVLGACGENAPKQPEEAKSEVAVEQNQDQQQDAQAATEEAPASTDEAPATTDTPAPSNDSPAE